MADHAPQQTGPLAPPRAAGIALVALGVLLLVVTLRYNFRFAAEETLLDVGVFRDAGAALLGGDPLYEGFPSRSGFAFIYPPFAALLFAPLTWMPELTMDMAWSTSIMAAIFCIMAMAARRLHLEPWWAWAVALTGFSTCLDTVASNLYYGQINVFLILLVAADVLGFTPKPIRGIGVGVAAGIKLTPAAYGVIFLVRRDWWSVARSAGFFALTALIGFIIRPSESVYFWTVQFFETDRGGDVHYPPNQGLGGLLSRGLIDATTVESLSPIILLVFAAASIYTAYRLEQHGRSVESLLVVVLGISLGGPFAVSHHWVGIILVLPLLAAAKEPSLRALSALTAGALLVPGYRLVSEEAAQEFEWPLWFDTNVIGLMGLTMYVSYFVLACTWLREPPQQAGAGEAESGADPRASHRTAGPGSTVIDAEDARAGELHG